MAFFTVQTITSAATGVIAEQILVGRQLCAIYCPVRMRKQAESDI